MKGKYFKPRKIFSFKPNKYDLGTLTSIKSRRDAFFLNKLMKLEEENEFLELYDRHSNHYQEISDKPIEAKKEFFEALMELLENELEKEKNLDGKKASNWRKRDNNNRLERFPEFIKLLAKHRDEWGIYENDKETLRRIEGELRKALNKTSFLQDENKALKDELKRKNKELRDVKGQLSQFRIFNNKKISVRRGDFATLINLFLKLKNLQDPKWKKDRRSKGEFFQTKSSNTWVKLIANNFSEDGEEITYSRVENYIVRDRSPKKGTRDIKIEIFKDESD